jgi:hypothetical protein
MAMRGAAISASGLRSARLDSSNTRTDMQNCGSALLALLESSSRDLAPVDLYEFYHPAETRLEPAYAVRRYAADTIFWHGWEYERQVLSRGDVSRYIDGRFNNVNLTFSNIDRSVSNWLSTTDLEGYRVLIRLVSRSIDNDSVVLFVGRCEPLYDVDNTTVTLNVRQDLGSIDNERCRGASISPVVRCASKAPNVWPVRRSTRRHWPIRRRLAATNPGRSVRSMATRSPFRAFALTRSRPTSRSRRSTGGSSWLHPSPGSLAFSAAGHKNWSSQDETPYGRPVPIGAGRTQLELQPVNAADTGEYLYGHWIVGEGRISRLLNVRNVSLAGPIGFRPTMSTMGTTAITPRSRPSRSFSASITTRDAPTSRRPFAVTIRRLAMPHRRSSPPCSGRRCRRQG